MTTNARTHMKPKMIGTIYATAAQLDRADAFADRQRARFVAAAEAIPEIAACEKRREEGETRYYATATRFAVVKQSGGVNWFERRDDGVYAARK